MRCLRKRESLVRHGGEWVPSTALPTQDARNYRPRQHAADRCLTCDAPAVRTLCGKCLAYFRDGVGERGRR